MNKYLKMAVQISQQSNNTLREAAPTKNGIVPS